MLSRQPAVTELVAVCCQARPPWNSIDRSLWDFRESFFFFLVRVWVCVGRCQRKPGEWIRFGCERQVSHENTDLPMMIPPSSQYLPISISSIDVTSFAEVEYLFAPALLSSSLIFGRKSVDALLLLSSPSWMVVAVPLSGVSCLFAPAICFDHFVFSSTKQFIDFVTTVEANSKYKQ